MGLGFGWLGGLMSFAGGAFDNLAAASHFLLSETAASVAMITLPGVARRPLTFFASPKKVSKERRTR
jgi:hypothetical protein